MHPMFRLIAAFILFPQFLCNSLVAQESPEQILGRTEEVYRDLKTYKFSGTLAYEWSSQKNRSRIFGESFQCLRGEKGRLRYQRGMGMSKILAVTDGKNSVLYLADKRQYQKSDSPDFEAWVRTSLDIGDIAWIFPSVAFLDKYSHLRKGFHDAKFLGNQDLNLDGGKVPCVVVEGVMDPVDIDAVWGNRRTQLWIDPDHRVRREVSIGTSTENAATDESLREVVTFDIAKANEVSGEDSFIFDPPNGAEEVGELFPRAAAKDRPQTFYYELPFVAMKNFKLPTVDGEEFSLSRLRGKLVFLDFWATWCVPCHKQMNELEQILRKYKGKDVAVLGLSSEGAERIRSFLGRRTPAYPLLVDAEGKLTSLYGAATLPTLVLLDRFGKIIFKREELLTYEQIELLLRKAGL